MSEPTYNDKTITLYLLGALPEAEAERLDELSISDEEFAESLSAAEKELVDAYVQGELPGEMLQQFESHYLASPLRRERVRFARSLQALGERGPIDLRTTKSVETKQGWLAALRALLAPQPSIQWGLAAAVLVLLAVAGLFVIRSIRLRQQAEQNQASDQQRQAERQSEIARAGLPSPTSTPTLSPEASSLVAELNDGAAHITLDRNGNLSGVDNLSPAYQRMVKAALTNQQLNRSALLAGLNRRASSLMGSDDQGKKFSVTAPVGKVLLSDHPTLRWSPLAGTTNYVAEAYDEQFNLVAKSPELTNSSWTVAQPLKRGQKYSWQVKATKDGQEFTSPRPPAPQANFRILDQVKANELGEARRAYPASHLTLGLLYAQDGLLDEAEVEFRALQKANPNSPAARRLLASVEAMRH